MLRIFKEEGSKNSRNTTYQFWRQDNQPQELYSPHFVFQKINYIHYNPVAAGIVERPEHYLYRRQKTIMQQRNADYWIWNFYKSFVIN